MCCITYFFVIFILNSEHIFSGQNGWNLTLLVKLIVFEKSFIIFRSF